MLDLIDSSISPLILAPSVSTCADLPLNAQTGTCIFVEGMRRAFLFYNGSWIAFADVSYEAPPEIIITQEEQYFVV